MKITKGNRIILIILFTLTFQLMVFYVLDRQADQVLNPFFRLNHGYTVEDDLTDAREFHLSYNNKYLSFISGNRLRIIDLTRNKAIVFRENTPIPEGSVQAAQWLPDRNSLLFWQKNPFAGTTSLFGLDLDELTAPQEGGVWEAKLEKTLDFPVEKIVDWDVSTYTNTLYLLYQDGEPANKLVKIDITKSVNRLDNHRDAISGLAIANRFGTGFLELTAEGSGKSVVRLDDKQTLLAGGGDAVLLGCRDNQVMIGRVQENHLLAIETVKADPSDSKPQTVQIWQGWVDYQPVQVLISADSKILVLSSAWLDIFRPGGQHTRMTLANTAVLSPTGKMAMEIVPQKGRFTYYWRSVD